MRKRTLSSSSGRSSMGRRSFRDRTGSNAKAFFQSAFHSSSLPCHFLSLSAIPCSELLFVNCFNSGPALLLLWCISFHTCSDIVSLFHFPRALKIYLEKMMSSLSYLQNCESTIAKFSKYTILSSSSFASIFQCLPLDPLKVPTSGQT